MAVLCNLGHRTILATGTFWDNEFVPDSEPYEPDVEEEVGDITFDDSLSVNIHYCPVCKKVIDALVDGFAKGKFTKMTVLGEEEQLFAKKQAVVAWDEMQDKFVGVALEPAILSIIEKAISLGMLKIKSDARYPDKKTDQVESLVFWMDELLRLSRELQRDLKRFYEPIKGWPSHIEALEGTTDFDTVLEAGKQFLQNINQSE